MIISPIKASVASMSEEVKSMVFLSYATGNPNYIKNIDALAK